MRKKFTFIAILMFGMAINTFAQTIVGTDPENKNVVLEEFTGLNCGYCPDGHAIAQGIYDSHPDDVVLVAVHAGGFANPSAGQPDYRTDWGGSLDAQADVTGYPSGTVNRHLFPGWSQGSGTAIGRFNWVNASNVILNESSYLNVGCEATIITSTRQLAVLVEVYYTGDSPSSSNFLTVALMQNDIIGYQASGGSNYHHMHMLRHFLTGQWGFEITETSQGTLYSTTLYYEIPEDIRDVEVVLEDLEIAAYVAENHHEIISGTMGEVTFVNSLDLDAGIVASNIPQTSCGDEMHAELTIKNYGTDNLTSLDFEYQVTDGESQTYTWTGNLSQHETEVVALPSFEIDADQSNIFSLISDNPNNSIDELPANNSFTADFELSSYLPQNCKLAILTDQNPEETTWDIKDSNGDIIASGGPYAVTTIFIEEFTWPADGCFTLTMYDAGGDGMDGGFYKIVKSNNSPIWEGNTNFATKASAEFSYDEVMDVTQMPEIDHINIYPNPIIESAQIEFTLLEQSTINMDLYNLLGKKVVHLYAGKMPAGNQSITITTGDLEQGIYFLNIEIDGKIISKKVNVVK